MRDYWDITLKNPPKPGKINQAWIVWGEVKLMAHNNHIGAANDRRPVNSKNVKKRRKEHLAVLDFLKEREEADKAAK